MQPLVTSRGEPDGRASLADTPSGTTRGAMTARVLHVFSVADTGGAEAVSLNIARFRVSAAIEHVAAIVNDEHGTLENAFRNLGVPVTVTPRGRMRNPLSVVRAARELRRLVRTVRPHVLLANSAQAFLYARIATLGLGLPVAIYYMAVPHRRLWRNGMLDILMAMTRPAAVFTASKTIGMLVSQWGLPNVIPVYHGTPATVPRQEDVEEVRAELATLMIGEHDPVVLLPGRLQPWKGQGLLIEAFSDVLRAHPNAHAVLLGGTLFGLDTAYPAHLRALVAHRGLEGHVHILGHRPIVRAWIERATVVVHASITPDAFPNVCIEALAARRPLITNTLAGTTEIVAEGRGALIIPPRDAKALAAAIIRVLDDGKAAASMAQRGFDCYSAAATPSHMVRPIETELKRLARATHA